jgi:hypothetical protein
MAEVEAGSLSPCIDQPHKAAFGPLTRGVIVMKSLLRALALGVFFTSGSIQSGAFAQSPLLLYEPENTDLPGFHTDVFFPLSPQDVNRPILSMFLHLELYGMKHVQLEDQPTIFRKDLPATLAPNDSHFLLDPSQFTVLNASEDDKILQVDIMFTDSVVFPSPFPVLIQAVAEDGHENPDGSFGTFEGGGQFQDGGTFRFEYAIIPEPSTLLLTLIALAVVGGWRKWGG